MHPAQQAYLKSYLCKKCFAKHMAKDELLVHAPETCAKCPKTLTVPGKKQKSTIR